MFWRANMPIGRKQSTTILTGRQQERCSRIGGGGLTAQGGPFSGCAREHQCSGPQARM
jgi:hypothetical protein